jgi:hypothetical protein
VLAFMISAAMMSVAGTFYAHAPARRRRWVAPRAAARMRSAKRMIT